MYNNPMLEFAERAVQAGDFDENVIEALQVVFAKFKELKHENAIYQQILDHLDIDEDWENADGQPVKPLFEALEANQ